MVIVYNVKVQKKKRQYLRNNSTKTEKILWNELKDSKLGYKFRRQHGINNYIIDFYCPRLKVAVEADGETHNYKKQRESDIKRDEVLKKLKINTIRIKNNEIINNLDSVIEKIKEYCDKLNYKIK